VNERTDKRDLPSVKGSRKRMPVKHALPIFRPHNLKQIIDFLDFLDFASI
jgi:hypothetical protein